MVAVLHHLHNHNASTNSGNFVANDPTQPVPIQGSAGGAATPYAPSYGSQNAASGGGGALGSGSTGSGATGGGGGAGIRLNISGYDKLYAAGGGGGATYGGRGQNGSGGFGGYGSVAGQDGVNGTGGGGGGGGAGYTLVDIPIAEVMVVMVSSSSHIQPNLNSKKSYIRCPRLN